MNQSEKLDLLFAALIKVQGELRGAKKDAANPFFKSSYADLESCWTAAREPLQKNGLCVIQTTDFVDGEAGLVTTLGHNSGQWIRGFLPLNMKSKDPQGQGSAITYARRYALAAIIGLIQVDDDGEAAMSRGVKPEQPPAGDGHQKSGYVMPAIAGRLAGKYLDAIHLDELMGLATAIEEKYKGKTMPPATGNLFQVVCDRIASLEQGESA